MILPATPAAIAQAAALLARDGLVAFPTETVYGLGANALSETAIRKIYSAKGRPSTSPLIVHVASLAMARSLVTAWPPAADLLAQAFWPGPLTLILPKAPHVPNALSAGLPTVGLRWPAHPVAQALIQAANLPLAAPSANLFTHLSPTTAAHVESSLGNRVDLILDGGPCTVGIESTVLSLATNPPRLLRPGMISQPQIEAIVGPVSLSGPTGPAHESPGQHHRHYAPRTPLHLVSRWQDLPSSGNGAYFYLSSPSPAHPSFRMPADPAAYAAALYETLHRADSEGYTWLAVELGPAENSWLAIHDRLRRASS